MNTNCYNKRPGRKPKCQCDGRDQVFFKKNVIPAELGDDVENPPKQGAYKDTLLVYEANNHSYLYDSNGMYTYLTISTSFNGLDDRPKYGGQVMTSETDIPNLEGAVSELGQDVSNLDATVSGLSNRVTIAEGDIVGLDADVQDIQEVIPSQATASNKLADQATVSAALAPLMTQIGDVSNALTTETSNRTSGDSNLQSQIDAITSASDVVDVVGTYAELQAYDTQHLKDNDIVKVLVDESHQNAISYYRWTFSTTPHSWVYVGSQGPFYTKSEADDLLDGKVDKVSGKGLSTNDYTTAEKNTLSSLDSNAVLSADIRNIVSMTQTAYEALAVKDPNTAYWTWEE